jgi:hypothetical protein
MNNQNSANGAASPKLQPMMDPAPNDSGQGPEIVSSMDTPPVLADTADQGGASGTSEPDSKKGGQV